MRALVLERFGRMIIADIDAPTPGPGEVALRISAVGICGSDIHGYTGENGRRVPGQIMGHEASGRILSIGAGVKRDDLAVGGAATFNPVVLPPADLAAWRGREQHHPGRYIIGVRPDVAAAFADVLIVPATNVVPLSPETPIEHGALVEPLAVALHAVRRSGARPGDAVLVLGGGPIGQSIVVALTMMGIADPMVSELDGARRHLVESLGAAAIAADDPDPFNLVTSHWGRPADAALDAVGIEPTMRTALTATRLGATVVLVGMGSPALTLDAYRVSTEERTIVGSFTYTHDDFRDAARFIESAPETAALLISEEVTPEEADAAFARLSRGDGPAGKILVRF
jgi:threonine dehydrogenase-like Zn-dependent dehydrogenase